jgi:hypothetical protein
LTGSDLVGIGGAPVKAVHHAVTITIGIAHPASTDARGQLQGIGRTAIGSIAGAITIHILEQTGALTVGAPIIAGGACVAVITGRTRRGASVRAEVFVHVVPVVALLVAPRAGGGHDAIAAAGRLARVGAAIRVEGVPVVALLARIDEAIAMSAMYIANHLKVRAIGALTESGSTPLWMSRISSGIPIFALTPHDKMCRRMTLFRGVYPISFKPETSDHAVLNRAIVEEFLQRKLATEDDLVILTKGDLTGVKGGTNAVKISRITDVLAAAPGIGTT